MADKNVSCMGELEIEVSKLEHTFKQAKSLSQWESLHILIHHLGKID